jgi:hypothetical protein
MLVRCRPSGFAASWHTPRILKYLACLLFLHCLQEPLTNGRIDAIGLRQRPLTPLFDFVDRRGTVECPCLSDCLDILPYLTSLLKRCGIREKPVYSALLNSFLPFFLCALNGAACQGFGR